MSEEPIRSPGEDRAGAAPALAEDGAGEAPRPARPVRTARPTAALWLAALLALVIAGVALSPFWAPPIAGLLPWGDAMAAAKYDALAAKIAALEQRPAPPIVDVAAITSAHMALAQRVGALETAVDALHRNQQQASAAQTAVAQLKQHVDELAAQSASRAGSAAAELEKIDKQLVQRQAADGDLAGRIAALEHQVQTQESADRTGSALMLALLQMREAVDEARPFPTQYEAFRQLAAGLPDLAAASRTLADVARSGVASRAALQQGLSDLAGQIATATPPAAERRWWEQALDRLRGLVTIRRIGGGAATGPQAAVAAAQSAMGHGDLAGAVAAIDKLSGGDAEKARSWLQMARRRLAAEENLVRLQELLAARLSKVPPASPAATSPPAPAAPTSPPGAAPKTPS